MNKFRKPHGSNRGGGGFGDRPGFGGPKRSFDRPARPSFGGQREMFDAVCSNCGKPCQVPFKPNGKKPVFCSNCFNVPRGEASSAPRDNFPRRDDRPFAPRPFEAQAFNRPSSRPAFAPQPHEREIAALQRQMDIVTSKLDSIMKLLEPLSMTIAPAKAVPAIPAELPATKPEPKKMLIKEIPKKKTVSTKKKSPAKK